MNKIVGAIVILIILVGLGMFLMNSKDEETSDNNTNQQSTSEQQQEASNPIATGSEQTVIFNDVGFSPEMLTSKVGERLLIENKTGRQIEVQSSPHPAHSGSPELNIGVIEPGETAAVTLSTAGTFNFHEEQAPDKQVKVVVQ
ncbi:MAG: cupredoxin domain-containing protein [bacterium]|nr:cupredoxin domain-containing protein [bacterium]